jgi:hypothetical protein
MMVATSSGVRPFRECCLPSNVPRMASIYLALILVAATATPALTRGPRVAVLRKYSTVFPYSSAGRFNSHHLRPANAQLVNCGLKGEARALNRDRGPKPLLCRPANTRFFVTSVFIDLAAPQPQAMRTSRILRPFVGDRKINLRNVPQNPSGSRD